MAHASVLSAAGASLEPTPSLNTTIFDRTVPTFDSTICPSLRCSASCVARADACTLSSESGQTATMTTEQAHWVQTMRVTSKAQPVKAARPPDGLVQRASFGVAVPSLFDYFIVLVIALNVDVVACDFEGIQTSEDCAFLWYSNALLTFGYVYYVECTLKLTGLGPQSYFADDVRAATPRPCHYMPRTWLTAPAPRRARACLRTLSRRFFPLPPVCLHACAAAPLQVLPRLHGHALSVPHRRQLERHGG